MKRLAIYAHYNRSPEVAGWVLYCLEQIAALGFRICFVSNSEISSASGLALKKFCERTMVRENTGLDFAMWQRGLAEYDLPAFDELLLTNSSIIGPVQPLGPVWLNAAVADCDFWGLTDSDELSPHLQSYFLVFRKPVLQSPRFAAFWQAVLPYQNKRQLIRSYEIGLTRWLEEGGFKWRIVYPQAEVWRQFQQQRGLLRTVVKRMLRRNLKPVNSTLYASDILLESGMPFVKAALLTRIHSPLNDRRTIAWLRNARLPAEIRKALEHYPPV